MNWWTQRNWRDNSRLRRRLFTLGIGEGGYPACEPAGGRFSLTLPRWNRHCETGQRRGGRYRDNFPLASHCRGSLERICREIPGRIRRKMVGDVWRAGGGAGGTRGPRCWAKNISRLLEFFSVACRSTMERILYVSRTYGESRSFRLLHICASCRRGTLAVYWGGWNFFPRAHPDRDAKYWFL